jgi:histone acetyltransferase 1
MRFFIILFIEGGQFINEDEDLWEFAVLCVLCLRSMLRTATEPLHHDRRYEKRIRPPTPDAPPSAPRGYSYHFVGYTSLYPFFNYPDRIRLRLSQFFVLPGHQNQCVCRRPDRPRGRHC